MTTILKRLPVQSADRALKVIGGRYKLHLLWHCLEEPRRFSELAALVPQATEKTLVHQLREMTAHGMLVKSDAGYAATELGEALRPLIRELCEWGRLHQRRMPCGATGLGETA